jgi:hypothetical protein
LNDRATNQLVLEPDLQGRTVKSVGPITRAAKFVGDVLWWSFLTAIFASITIGVATELLF